MTLVYTIDTGKFEPISHGNNYLYNQYDRIQSFLLKNYGGKYQHILAKPLLTNGQVQWFANFTQPLSKLSDLGEEVQQEIKTKYWEARTQIDNDIRQLELSHETEKRNWALLLKEVFNDDDNLLLSDGNGWCLLWGWRFRSKADNYLSPEFMKKIFQTPDTSIADSTPLVNTGSVDESPVPPVETTPEPIPVITETNDNIPPVVNPSLWDRLKRFLRTAVYRLWGLMLLIMLILMIVCMCKRCCYKRMNEDCNRMDSLNKQLQEVERKAKERCNPK